MGKTSTEVKRRYNEKVYSRVSVTGPKKLVAEFKIKCKEEGVSQNAVLNEAMRSFVAGSWDFPISQDTKS